MEGCEFDTRLFLNIFPDYETFKEWYKSLPLSSGDNDCPSEKTFALIKYEYDDCHVAFSVEGFKQHFAIDLYSYYREFEGTTKRIDQLMSLTDEDVSIDGINVMNMAQIPEEESSTDVETVNFITSQQKSKMIKGKTQIAREQLSNQRAYTVQKFLKRFAHLFIKIISPSYTFVVEEDDEE